jgi:N-acetylmuramic acid 6-phosphate (MurNAc-6-P) etherase
MKNCLQYSNEACPIHNEEPGMSRVLQLLNLDPSLQSVDYVTNKQQYHLFNLLTEQRHPKTWNLSFAVQADIEAGLKMLLSVDEDISRRLEELVRDPSVLEQAAAAVVQAVRSGRRIYVYGCGATGRLAKQMESDFWRPFWGRVKRHSLWEKLKRHLPAGIESALVGEMTGADRALVSSLEGFEDLQLIGRLQLHDHGISRGDVVICVTEGGETSSVIGTILAALAQYGELDPETREAARSNLYFVYNNPDEVLRPFHRSASVIDNPAITKINLTTGPQGITGSTRLQATTSETFVVGIILEEAIGRVLAEQLSSRELAELGFAPNTMRGRLQAFASVKSAVDRAAGPMARFTELETGVYRRGRFATYFAKTGMITVFIDNTERSPTFRLFPLDKVEDEERRCWVQVWTEAADGREAWRNFLGRPFKGLQPSRYREPFELEVEDPYLREAALRSLANAGDDQEFSYDFSFSASNVQKRGPSAGDLGVLVLVDDEVHELEDSRSASGRFMSLFRNVGGKVAILAVTGPELANKSGPLRQQLRSDAVLVHVVLQEGEDPLTVRRQIALKMLLNGHSTAIMAALGRVIGNTMTNVSPSNLKLIGRATYLILTHANDVISRPDWAGRVGRVQPITFAEANAVLLDAIDYVRSEAMGQTAEVALSIIRILEALQRRRAVGWDEARAILDGEGLAAYLMRQNPALASGSRT